MDITATPARCREFPRPTNPFQTKDSRGNVGTDHSPGQTLRKGRGKEEVGGTGAGNRTHASRALADAALGYLKTKIAARISSGPPQKYSPASSPAPNSRAVEHPEACATTQRYTRGMVCNECNSSCLIRPLCHCLVVRRRLVR